MVQLRETLNRGKFKGRCASRATPERERRSAATFLWKFSIVRWRRGVGRQSPTKRGRIVRSNKDKLPIIIFANGTNQAYRRFNSEVQQRCIDDMAEHRGWGKGRGQGRKSPAAMRA